ncbi:MAG: hypothetical protein AAF597_05870, partial [Bacteroidota bacterium]
MKEVFSWVVVPELSWCLMTLPSFKTAAYKLSPLPEKKTTPSFMGKVNISSVDSAPAARLNTLIVSEAF